MKILLSGASGLVGSALVPELVQSNHDVATLVRSGASGPKEISWEPDTGELDQQKLERWRGPDAVVHLAGEGIANHRWTRKQKERIRDSRIRATEGLTASLLKLAHPPSAFISASAIGYYGDREEEILNEQSGAGTGFLKEVVVGWENAADALARNGVRVVHLRFGMILSAKGGALRKMLPPFRMGLGGPLSSGEQWMSWIALRDVVRLILFMLERSGLSGIFNAVSPQPVRNRDFTKTLGEVLHRPAFFRAPKFVLRLALGSELADELLLSSTRVLPARLQASGFSFRYPDLKNALLHELNPEKGQ